MTLVAPGEPGAKLLVTGEVVSQDGKPIPDARLHVYQTDTSGRYTPERAMDEQHARLAGWLHTDGQGRFELHTVRPGGYPEAVRIDDQERKIPAHIHIDVTARGHTPRKLQVVFANDPLLADPYWQQWAERAQHPILTLRSAGATSTATLRIELQPAPR